MLRSLLRPLILLSLVPLAGCLSSGGGPSLSPQRAPGVAALGIGLIGTVPGVTLPEDARAQALQAEYQALQFTAAGQPVAWNAEGYRGEVVPTQLYRVGSQDCRGYSHTLYGGTQPVKEVGTACRTQAGVWTPVA